MLPKFCPKAQLTCFYWIIKSLYLAIPGFAYLATTFDPGLPNFIIRGICIFVTDYNFYPSAWRVKENLSYNQVIA